MTKQSSTPKIATKKHIARLERERRQVALIRTISIISIALVVILVGYGILDTTYLKMNQAVAEVNGEEISLGYWQERVQMYRLNLINTLQQYQYYQQTFGMDTSQQQQEIQTQLQSDPFLGETVINQIVDETLIRQEAQKRGITVTDAEVEERIQNLYNFYPNGTPSPTVTPTEFSTPTLSATQKALFQPTSTPTKPSVTATPSPTNTPEPAATATSTQVATPSPLPQPPTATATPYTLEGFKTQYADTLDNYNNVKVSEKTVRSIYANLLYQEKLMAEIVKDTPNTEEQVWARHILIKDAQLATSVYEKLKAGLNFAEAASQYSEDTGSAVNGGDLGWFGKGQMVPEFEQAALSQPVGEIGKPVQSEFGYHIIQVIARQQLPVSASRYDQLKQEAFENWLNTTREEGKTAETIKIFNELWQANIPAMPAAVPF
ncbi:MAG TPA: peptidylprolyl isomerase [Anaerolineales bacterium]|nr:peptidylprolyl isomerase [Anaerolineales bacterium]